MIDVEEYEYKDTIESKVCNDLIEFLETLNQNILDLKYEDKDLDLNIFFGNIKLFLGDIIEIIENIPSKLLYLRDNSDDINVYDPFMRRYARCNEKISNIKNVYNKYKNSEPLDGEDKLLEKMANRMKEFNHEESIHYIVLKNLEIFARELEHEIIYGLRYPFDNKQKDIFSNSAYDLEYIVNISKKIRNYLRGDDCELRRMKELNIIKKYLED